MSRTVTYRERVANEVRAAIIAGHMRPGVVYSAPVIAARHQISVTPVREALLDLVKEGLLEPVRNKGFRVVEPSDDDLDEIAAVRDLLEPATVAEVARTATPEQLAELRAFAGEIAKHAKSGAIEAYVQADRDFHLAVIAATGNKRLLEIVAQLRSQARLFGLEKIAKDGQLESSSHDHDELLEAIEGHDGVRAEAIMRAHLGQLRTYRR